MTHLDPYCHARLAGAQFAHPGLPDPSAGLDATSCRPAHYSPGLDSRFETGLRRTRVLDIYKISVVAAAIALLRPVPWLLYAVWLHRRGHDDADARVARLIQAYRRLQRWSPGSP